MFREFVRENRDDLMLVAGWGDGNCGALLEVLREELDTQAPVYPKPKKQRIPRDLAKRVFERDAYRCVVCGSWVDLTCDHITPESKGGPTTEENLQTMCRTCNCRKGARE